MRWGLCPAGHGDRSLQMTAYVHGCFALLLFASALPTDTGLMLGQSSGLLNADIARSMDDCPDALTCMYKYIPT